MFANSGSRGIVLRKLEGRLTALFQSGTGAHTGGGAPSLSAFMPSTKTVLFALLAIVLIAMTFAVISAFSAESLYLIAPAGIATTRDLKTILGELTALQDSHKGKAMPADVGEKFEALAAEAKVYQDEADRAKRVADLAELERKGRTPIGAAVPGAVQPSIDDEFKTEKPAGFMSLGDYIAFGEGLKDFIAAGMPKVNTVLANLEGMKSRALFRDRGRKSTAYVAISREERKAFHKLFEGKAVPTIGSGVLEPERLSEIVRVTEHDRLRLRDVLNISTTSQEAVSWNRLVSVTRAAATVAHGTSKPQSAMEFQNTQTGVKTIAVWIPVNNQQLADMPALAGIINTELLYDLDKTVEELVMYGDGVGENFDGIVPDAGVLDMDDRIQGTDTLIDIARRMMTDVIVSGYEPNALLIDPRDWENVVLAKGTDDRYVWTVVTENGVARLWGTPIVETVAMMNPEDESRNMVLGDWRRGATLWDREQSNVTVGWQDQQFIKNQRTILAELRAAFAVVRPKAFRKHNTTAS